MKMIIETHSESCTGWLRVGMQAVERPNSTIAWTPRFQRCAICESNDVPTTPSITRIVDPFELVRTGRKAEVEIPF